MSIPDYETLMLPLLKIAESKRGNEISLLESIGKLADQYKLTEEERRELLPSTQVKHSNLKRYSR